VKKKTKRWIAFSVAMVLLMGMGAVAYWQRNNISALIDSQTLTQEERTAKLAAREGDLLKKISEQDPAIQVNPLTEEQEQLLKEGKLTPEAALDIIMGKGDKAVKTSAGSTPEEDTQTAGDSKLNSLIAQIYLLRSSFTGQLNGLVAQAKQEYIAGGGKVSKESIAARYIGIAGGLEAQCDGQMEAILSQIKAELERTGGDMSLISQIRSTYRGEKSAKKAQLLSQF